MINQGGLEHFINLVLCFLPFLLWDLHEYNLKETIVFLHKAYVSTTSGKPNFGVKFCMYAHRTSMSDS